MLKHLVMLMQKAFVSFSTEYTTSGTQTVAVPAGATTVTVECIGAGGGNCAHPGSTTWYGGCGGAYAKKNSYSLAGISNLYLSVSAGQAGTSGPLGRPGTFTFVTTENSGGTTICAAQDAGTYNYEALASASTGDTKYNGGSAGYVNEEVGGGYFCGGGGAAGPSGAGSAGLSQQNSGDAGGASGGSPAGKGGSQNNTGALYGGGAGDVYGDNTLTAGAQGWIKLTWA